MACQIDIQCIVMSWRVTTYLVYYQESLPCWLVQFGTILQLLSVSVVPMFQIEPGRGLHHFHLVCPSTPPEVFWESSSHCQLGVGEHLGIWFNSDQNCCTTEVSQVIAHGHLNVTYDFGPHGCLPGIWFPCLFRNCYIVPLKCATCGSGRFPSTLRYNTF